LKKYTDFIFAHKKILFILFLLLNLTALVGVTRIKLDTDFASFSPTDSIYQDRLDELELVFGELNQLIVITEVDDLTSTVLTDVNSIQNKLGALESVTYVEGAAPNEFAMNGTMVPYSNLSKAQIVEYYSAFEDFSPLKIGEKQYQYVYTLFISDDISANDIGAIEDILESYTYNSYISGDSYNQLKITDYIIRILLLLPPLSLLIIFAVFRWQMGAMKPTLLSVLPAGVGALWTFGLIGWIGNEVSILTAIVPIFIIVIGSADGLHFMSHYQDSMAEGKTNKEGLMGTLKLVGIPMVVTTLTSIAGFLSLLTIDTESIKDLSIYSGVGILLAGIATWYVLPLILSTGLNVSRKNNKEPRFNPAKSLKKLIGIPSLVIVLIIVVASSLNYTRINNEFNMLMVYKDTTVVAKNAAKVSEVNGGSIPVYVTITPDSPVTTMDALKQVNILVTELDELDEVNKSVNPYHLLNIISNNQMQQELSNDETLSMIYNMISSDPNSTIHNLMNVENNTIRILVFPKDLNNDTLEIIEQTVDDMNFDTSVTGVQYLMKDLNDSISVMQLQSIILAFSVVFVMLIITLRSLKVAFYSLLPILVTVLSLYGFLGMSQIPLNITTVIIFSITIGVGIDYAVHFSSVYKTYLNETKDNALAIQEAYRHSSRPIIANALGISLGLTALMFSPLTIHFNVSILMWVSMIVSVVLTLTLLPFIFRKRGV
jgi:hypothetical protein